MNVCELVRNAAKAAGAPCVTPADLYTYFAGRVKKNLKIVLCFSPIGDAWRSRLRQFPSLVNCCVIDWYTKWPPDALEAVAGRFLAECFDGGIENKVCQSCVKMCQFFHTCAHALGERFKDELNRMYYATPTSFLELISTFTTLIGAKGKEIGDLKKKYDVGLEKLVQTENSVEGMKQELIDLQPKLIQKNKEVGELFVVVTKESEEAEKVAAVVAKDEANAQASADAANAIKTDCEADLAEAMPALQSALSALDTLTSKDITEIKAKPAGSRETGPHCRVCHEGDQAGA
jgi:dynein heavy chain